MTPINSIKRIALSIILLTPIATFAAEKGQPDQSAADQIQSILGVPEHGKDGNPGFSPELYEGNGWALFAPQGWRRSDISGLELYLRGDGITAMPLMDASFSPLMIGIVVDRNFPKGFALNDLPDMFKEPKGRLVKIEKVKLTSGLSGSLLTLRTPKENGARLTYNTMLVWLDKKGKGISITAYVTVASDSEIFLKKSGILDFLRAHLMIVGENRDAVSVKLAQLPYSVFDRQLSHAIATAYQANELVLNGKWNESIKLFDKALAMFEPIHGAHNGLAWALMKRNKNKTDLTQALVHAKRAVELSEGKSESALGTLKDVMAVVKK